MSESLSSLSVLFRLLGSSKAIPSLCDVSVIVVRTPCRALRGDVGFHVSRERDEPRSFGVWCVQVLLPETLPAKTSAYLSQNVRPSHAPYLLRFGSKGGSFIKGTKLVWGRPIHAGAALSLEHGTNPLPTSSPVNTQKGGKGSEWFGHDR